MNETRESARTVPFAESGCAIHRIHLPRPAGAEMHHVFPLFLQRRVRATDNERVPLCGTGHSDVHYAIDAILAKRVIPRGVGRSELKLAQLAVTRYRNAGGVV